MERRKYKGKGGCTQQTWGVNNKFVSSGYQASVTYCFGPIKA